MPYVSIASSAETNSRGHQIRAKAAPLQAMGECPLICRFEQRHNCHGWTEDKSLIRQSDFWNYRQR
jgi:hypothetical protein